MKNKFSLIYSIVFGIVIGWGVFFFLVKSSYTNLEDSISESLVFEGLFSNDPALFALKIRNKYSSDLLDSVSFYKDQLPYRILLNLDILTVEDDPSDVAKYINDPINELLAGTSSITDLRSLDLLTLILVSINKPDKDSDNWEENFKKAVTGCIANSPNSFNNYLDAMNEESEVQFEGNFQYLFPRELGSWGEEGDHQDLINYFFTHFSVGSEFVDLERRVLDGQVNQEEYRQLKEFIQAIILSINNDQAVEKAKNRVVVYHGLMQFFMIISFFISMFLILQRLLFNLKVIDISDRSLRNLPKFYNWITNSLPIMGFVGTIIGLMRALGDADQIPLAVGNINTSLAISDITNTLSIAFTTTLMAFVMVLILSLIDLIFQYYFERNILENE